MNTNHPDYFVETTRKHRALAVLRVLNRAPQHRSNELVIMDWLDEIGLVCSTAEFHLLMEVLQSGDYIEINSVDGISVLNITESGSEVAEGVILAENVARPRPNLNY